MTLTVKAFFFNAHRDYLPYYKQFSLQLSQEQQIQALLPLIQAANRDFHYPETECYFRVNGLVLNGTQSVKEVTDRLGTVLQIDPISTYRATDGLCINDDDFMQQFALLAPYTTAEDKHYYQSLYPLHYASETFQYNTSK